MHLRPEVAYHVRLDWLLLSRHTSVYLFHKKQFVEENRWACEMLRQADVLESFLQVADYEKMILRNFLKELEQKLKYNKTHYNCHSPLYNEVVIIDEVNNFVRQIINGKTYALIFYNWIVNATNVKLIFLSGTPIINKPSEIAILYNMLKGKIDVYNFTIQTNKTYEEIYSKLNDEYYSRFSPIDLFNIEYKMGKVIISFTQQNNNFETVMDKDTGIIYSVASKNNNFKKFMKEIFRGLNTLFKKDKIMHYKNDY